MAGVAARKVRADGGPGAAPKARQVAGDLDRTVSGREQMKGERDTPAGQRRVLVEPEKLLDAQRDRWAALGFIVDERPVPGWRLKMGRRFVGEAPRQVPGQRRVERAGEIVGPDLVELRLANEEG